MICSLKLGLIPTGILSYNSLMLAQTGVP